MYSVVAGLLSLLLLGGCTQHKNDPFLISYKTDYLYHKELIKTEYLHFYDAYGMTKAVVTATYQGLQEKKEIFIIGIYVDSIKNMPLFKIELNGKHPIFIKALSSEDFQLQRLSFVSNWKHFYRIAFPQISEKKLYLKIVLQGIGEGKMYFAKKAKYTFEKKAF